MGTLALAIVVAVIAVGGPLALLVRRQLAQADHRDFAGGDASATVASDPGPGNAGSFCGDPGAVGDCGGDGGGDGGG